MQLPLFFFQFILVYSIVEHVPITYEGVDNAYEPWVDGMGWLMVALALIFIPLIALIEYCKAHGFIKV